MLLPCSLSSLVFGLLVSTSLAYPAPQSKSSQLASYGWPGRLQVLYEALGRRDTAGSRRDTQLSQIPCDMSKAVLPQGEHRSTADKFELPTLTIGSSTHSTSASRGRPVPLPRHHRPWHPELLLRDEHRCRQAQVGRRRGHAIQRQLRRRKLSGTARHHAERRSAVPHSPD